MTPSMEAIKCFLHELYSWLLYSWLPDGSREPCPAVQEFADYTVYGLVGLLSLNMVIILLLVASMRRQIARVEAENELRLQMLTLDMIDTVAASPQSLSAAPLPSSSQFLGLSDLGDPLPVAESMAYVVNNVKSNSNCTPELASEVDHAIDVTDSPSISVTNHANRVSSRANRLASHANSTGSISEYSTPSLASEQLEKSLSSESGKVLVEVLVKLKRLVHSSANTSRLRQNRQSRLAIELADVVDHASISASVSYSHANRATAHAYSTGSISKLYSTPSAMTMTIRPSELLEKSMSAESLSLPGKVLLKRLARSSNTSRQQHLTSSTSRRMSDRIRMRGTQNTNSSG